MYHAKQNIDYLVHSILTMETKHRMMSIALHEGENINILQRESYNTQVLAACFIFLNPNKCK